MLCRMPGLALHQVWCSQVLRVLKLSKIVMKLQQDVSLKPALMKLVDALSRPCLRAHIQPTPIWVI